MGRSKECYDRISGRRIYRRLWVSCARARGVAIPSYLLALRSQANARYLEAACETGDVEELHNLLTSGLSADLPTEVRN